MWDLTEDLPFGNISSYVERFHCLEYVPTVLGGVNALLPEVLSAALSAVIAH